MQVFRPYVDHGRSAAFLDDRRLGRQRVELKQVLLAILRRRGILRDGRRGWLNHPIVLMYDAGPYVDDLVRYFYAAVDEWTRRGFRNNISLDDVEPLLKQLAGAPGTPVTEDLAREYRRVLLLKEPCFYYRRLTAEELAELLSTPPRPYNGVNLWLFGMLEIYEAFMKRLAAGEVDCAGIFPRRR
ncbi:MAG: pyrimidine dimer DNA glycosylase [Pyrobaculum sp.]|nr:pyrimidine dimer DNA glycosylase [Pyrobaculum sp.]